MAILTASKESKSALINQVFSELPEAKFRTSESYKLTKQEPKILRIKQVLEIYPVGRSTLYKMIAEGKFNRPVSLGSKSVGWHSNYVYDFIAALESKS
jgi:prophage regulatory protein